MTVYKDDNQKGFTLIEIIGVLAILAIMAGMLAPNLIQQIESAREDAEEGNLERLAAGLEASILTTRIIPQSSWGNGGGDWAVNIFDQTNIPTPQIRINDVGCPRRYWFDPSTDLPDLPGNAYNQNTTATIPTKPPVNARAMLISDLTDSCSNNIYGSFTFWETWQQENSVLKESPTLKIQRMNLSQLFEPVALLNRSATQTMRRNFDVAGELGALPATQTAIVFTLPDVAVTGIPVTIESVTVNGSVVGQTTNVVSFDTPFTDLYLLVDAGNGGTSDDFYLRSDLIPNGNTGLPGVCTSDPTDGDNCPYTLKDGEQIRIVLDGFISGGGSNTPSRLSGFLDITVTYTTSANWQLIGQADNKNADGSPKTVINSTQVDAFDFSTGVAIPAQTIYVLNGTQLFLCAGAGDVDCQAGINGATQLASLFIKESDSFVFSPGPPAIWGR